MYDFIFILGISFLVSVMLTPIMKSVAIKFKIYDIAEGDELKIHKRPIPPTGGFAIMIGVLLITIIYMILTKIALTQGFAVIVSCLIISIFGFYDDLKWKHVTQSNTKLKVIIQQILTVGIAVLFYFTNIATPIIPIAVVSIFVAFCFINGLINAVNLQDGMDGLAGGIILISSIGFALIGAWQGSEVVYILALGLIGAILGFLIFNFNPAKIFMGDNGSFFLGLMISILAIFTINQSNNFILFVGVILIIGLPIFDMAFAILRRIKNRKPIFKGDRSHLYDLIHNHVSSIKKTVVIYYCIQTLFVLGGICVIKFLA